MEKFYLELKNIEKETIEKLNDTKPMKDVSEVQRQEFNNAKKCHICDKLFTEISDNHKGYIDMKVKDHCHLSGEYRGAAHATCNLNFQIPKNFPVIIHNSRGYDSHFIIKYLTESILPMRYNL